MRHGTAQSDATRNTGWGGLGESGRVRLKGGVPQQPWHNADGLFSLSLWFWHDVVARPSNPCPHPQSPNKSLSSLTDVQQQAPPCQRAPAPKQTPDCNLTPPPQQQLTYLGCEILTDPDSSWNPQKRVTVRAACSSAWRNFLVWARCQPDTCLHVRTPAPPRPVS